MMPRALTLFFWLVFAACTMSVLPGCGKGGYAFQDAYRTDIRTVAVPIFKNPTFFHGLEVTLTDAIVKEIHRTTPWRVASADGAETILSGSIDSAELRRLSRGSETGMVQEVAFEITVSFEWKKNAGGEVLVARRNFRSADAFVPARGAQERLNLGERAAVDQLARDIVAELRSSW
jgi:hypothetical protein